MTMEEVVKELHESATKLGKAGDTLQAVARNALVGAVTRPPLPVAMPPGWNRDEDLKAKVRQRAQSDPTLWQRIGHGQSPSVYRSNVFRNIFNRPGTAAVPQPGRIDQNKPTPSRATRQQPTINNVSPSRILGNLFRQSRFGQAGQAGQAAQQRVGSLLGGTGASGIAGLGGNAAMLARAAGPIGIAIAAVVEVGKAMNELRKAVLKLTDEQIQAARKLADAGSGAMAAVLNERDVKEMLRDQRKGNVQASSMRQLTEAEQRRKDATAPLENLLEIVTNKVLAAINNAVVPPLEILSEFAKKAAKKFDINLDEAAGDSGLAAAMPSIFAEASSAEKRAADLLATVREADARVRTGMVTPGGFRRP
jgi:hypothetical protein